MEHIFKVYQETVTCNATRTEQPGVEYNPQTDEFTNLTKPDKPVETDRSILDLSKIDPQNMTIKDRDKIVFQLYDAYPEKGQAQERIDLLNGTGILLNGQPWTIKNIQSN